MLETAMLPSAQGEPVATSVGRDAGLQSLEVPWLAGFLGGYVVLTGPVAFVALRRRRSLGWLVVPALAAVFTGAAWVIGTDLRSGTTASHGTVLELGPAGARATTVLGLVSRTGRDSTASFDPRWTVGLVDDPGWGVPGTPAELAVRTGAAGPRARLPLGVGGFGTMRATGPVAFDGALTVAARSEGAEVITTVTNDLPFAVSEVGVLLGRSNRLVGRLDPGETAEVVFDGSEQADDPWMPPEGQLWPAPAGFESPDPDSVVNLSVLNEAQAALGPNARQRGVVTVVGWTRAVDGFGDVDGQGAVPGRTAVVARAAVTSADGGVAPGAARRELVRGTLSVLLPAADVRTPVQGALYRFALPEGADGRPLALDVPSFVALADVWDGTAWVTVDDRLGTPELALPRTVDLPAGGAAGGVVWVRAWLRVDVGVFLDGAGLEVRDRP